MIHEFPVRNFGTSQKCVKIHRLLFLVNRCGFKTDVRDISRARNHQEKFPNLTQTTFTFHLPVQQTRVLGLLSPLLPPLRQVTLLQVCLSPPGSQL